MMEAVGWVDDTRFRRWREMTPMDAFEALRRDLGRCEKCGRLEFHDHDFSLPER